MVSIREQFNSVNRHQFDIKEEHSILQVNVASNKLGLTLYQADMLRVSIFFIANTSKVESNKMIAILTSI